MAHAAWRRMPPGKSFSRTRSVIIMSFRYYTSLVSPLHRIFDNHLHIIAYALYVAKCFVPRRPRPVTWWQFASPARAYAGTDVWHVRSAVGSVAWGGRRARQTTVLQPMFKHATLTLAGTGVSRGTPEEKSLQSYWRA
jgi:hypothetical protein